MICEAPASVIHRQVSPKANSAWVGALRSVENAIVSSALFVMVALPLAESLLRRLFHRGIPASISIVQHMVLVIGMVGAAIAAREGRLLSLSTLGDTVLKGRLKSTSTVFTGVVSSATSAFLSLASYQFVQTEREAGKILAFGIPVWVIECVLPIGFLVIAARILLHSSTKWVIRAAAAACSIWVVTILAHLQESIPHFAPIALGILFLASVLGAPAFVTLGGTAMILFAGEGQPIAAIPVAHYTLVTNPTLPTLPLFTLAGYFLAESGSPKRLIRFFYALFGNVHGAPAIVSVLVCAFFTSFTGASGVTILALGGLLKPVLDAAGYSEKDSLGLLTGAGSLGLLLPPCLPLIFYAIVARVPIQQMFLGGIVPAFVMIAAIAIWGVRRGSADNAGVHKFEWTEARAALWDAKWELALPLVACVGLFSGLMTPVEAAAFTALYAFLVETLVHRDLKLTRDLPRVATECGLLIGGVLLILGVSLGFTDYLVDAEIPARAVEWTTQTIHSPFVFLLLLNAFLLVVGCLMEIYPAIVVEVPLLVPLGAAYGIDPVRLGIIFLANMELGYLTPPVGLNLLMSSFRFGKSVPEVLRAVLPVVVVLSAGVLMITYVPGLTTALPKLFGY